MPNHRSDPEPHPVHDVLDRALGALVPLSAGSSSFAGVPVIMLPPLPGHHAPYVTLAAELRLAAPVFAMRARGLEDGEQPPVESLEEMSTGFVRLLDRVLPSQGYVLVGYSMGGLVAMEMAHELASRGKTVPVVVLLDAYVPDDMPRFESAADFLTWIFGDHLGLRRHELEGRAHADMLAIVRGAFERVGHPFPTSMTERWLRAFEVHQEAMFRYRPRPYDGTVAFFGSVDEYPRMPRSPARPWRALVRGRLAIHPAEGDHISMVMPTNVARWAPRLRAYLAEAVPEVVD